MEKEFVPFWAAVKLKELGFCEKCLGYYFKPGKEPFLLTNENEFESRTDTLAALLQQAFDWFRTKYNLGYSIHPITLDAFVTNINNAELLNQNQ